MSSIIDSKDVTYGRNFPARTGHARGWKIPGLRLLLAAALASVLAQCTTVRQADIAPATEQKSDLARTWENAWVIIPQGKIIRHYRMNDKVVKHWQAGHWRGPMVLYLHGCTGLGSADTRLLDYVAAQGFLVVAPDSFARRYRPMQCDPKKQTGGLNLFVYDFRQAEINYALQQIEATAWIESKTKILFGASEGAVAAALYRGSAFKARIITHWTCHGGPLVAGISAPRDEPLLTIVEAEDPWYKSSHTTGQSGDCSAFFAGRPNARSLRLEDGAEHNVFKSKKARTAIAEFLSTYGK